MSKKFVTVFSHKMCNGLIERGYNVAEVKQDNRFPERTVFFFKNSEGLRKAMAEISK